MPGLLGGLFEGGGLGGLLGGLLGQEKNKLPFEKIAFGQANQRPQAVAPPTPPPLPKAQPAGIPANAMPGILSTLGDRLNNPLTQMSLQLLANSQPSTTPVSTGELLGQAALGLRSAQREDELLALLEALRRD